MYQVTFPTEDIRDFVVTDDTGLPVFLTVYPVTRGPLMVRLGKGSKPVSVYDLWADNELPGHRVVPRDRNYKAIPTTESTELVPVTQLDTEHRTAKHLGRPATLSFEKVCDIATKLLTQPIHQVAKECGVCVTTVAQISSRKRYWYV